MSHLISFVKGAGLGAGLMYFLDPDLGRRRRSLVRDQCVRIANQLVDAADCTARDVQNRLYGTVAELQSSMRELGETPDDELLVSRVRSKLGRYVSHPGAIEVTAQDGCVTLGGPILASEVQDVVRAIESVRGVCEVDNQLDVHQSADISALQGGVRPTGEPAEWMQSNWSPAMRLGASAAGLALVGNCMVRRSLSGMLLGMMGTGLILRSLANDAQGGPGGRQGSRAGRGSQQGTSGKGGYPRRTGSQYGGREGSDELVSQPPARTERLANQSTAQPIVE
jgi:hypothetical protein